MALTCIQRQDVSANSANKSEMRPNFAKRTLQSSFLLKFKYFCTVSIKINIPFRRRNLRFSSPFSWSAAVHIRLFSVTRQVTPSVFIAAFYAQWKKSESICELIATLIQLIFSLGGNKPSLSTAAWWLSFKEYRQDIQLHSRSIEQEPYNTLLRTECLLIICRVPPKGRTKTIRRNDITSVEGVL